MAIISRIKSAAKKVASSVKGAYQGVRAGVTNALNKVTGKATSASSINALDYNNPVNNQLQAENKARQIISQAGGAPMTPLSPESKARQLLATPAPNTPFSIPAGSRGGSKSNYSSPSYSTNFLSGGSSSFSAPSSTSVAAGTIGTQSNNIASAPSTVNYQGTALGGNVSVGGDPNTGIIPTGVSSTTGESVAGEPEKESASSALDTYLDSLKAPADEGRLYDKALKESGLRAAKQQRSNTQAQINAITTQMNTDLLQLRGTAAREGVTEAVYGGQQAQVSREATIKLLPLQAQLAVDQDNVQLAESHLDTLYKIYVDDAQASVDFYNNQAKAIYENASAKEKRQLDEMSTQKEVERELLKDDVDFQRSSASQALKDGNIRLYNALTSIRPPTNINSPSYQNDKQNYIDDVNDAVSRYGASASTTKSGVLAKLPVSIQGKLISKAESFENRDIAKKYNATVDAINIVNAIDPNSKNPADHQQIVYAFAKALDPDSAVKEGEYDTIKKYAQSAFSRYKKELSNAINGTGFLSSAAIKNIQATMNQTFQSRKPIYDNALQETKRIINSIAGIDVADEIMVDYSGGVENKDSGGGQVVIAPDGTEVIIVD